MSKFILVNYNIDDALNIYGMYTNKLDAFHDMMKDIAGKYAVSIDIANTQVPEIYYDYQEGCYDLHWGEDWANCYYIDPDNDKNKIEDHYQIWEV